MKRFEFNILHKIILIVAALAGVTAHEAMSYPAGHYAEHSVLAEGKWAKVKVNATGAHLIPASDLRAMGFQDISKVHVYGYGGRMEPEALKVTTHFDLPLLPSVVTEKGVIFFATDFFTWDRDASDSNLYTHEINPYSEESVYFISDREVTVEEMQKIHSPGFSGPVKDTFRAHLVHEQDLYNPGETGRRMLGEDFRSQRKQVFTFDLPDHRGDRTWVRTAFGALVTNGQSSLMFTDGGKRLPSEEGDIIPAPSKGSDDSFIIYPKKDMVKECSPSERLQFGIEYSNTGVLFKARLDWIEVFYDRALSLRDGQLHFYGNYSVGDALRVSGVSSGTRIWDVTDPGNPQEVDFSLSDSQASFTIGQAGYREFIAFNPDAVTLRAESAGAVANQDIHGLEVPDMVIITLPEYMEGAKRIAVLHEKVDGFRVHVLTPDLIYNEFSSGTADVTAFRKLLKKWYDSPGDRRLGYCLLMGKPSYDNKMKSAEVRGAGYTPLLIWQSPTGVKEVESYSIDDYIGMLDDNDAKGFLMSQADISVAVGRIPVTSGAEALDMARKIENHVLTPDYGPWRNKLMVIADDSDDNAHFKQAQDVVAGLESTPLGKAAVYDRLYLDAFPLVQTSVGLTYPGASARLKQNFNDGISFADYIGHASPKGWGHENLFMWNDIVGMRNKRLGLLLAATCGFAFWDGVEKSGGEEMVLNPSGGVIAMIAATRTVYISSNGTLNKQMAPFITSRDDDGMPVRMGEAYRRGRNVSKMSNSLRYAFLGDPALRMPGGAGDVCFTSIDGQDITDDSSEVPVAKALGSIVVEGTVRNADGSVDTGFNGTVNIQLYDAEKVITTFGNQSGSPVNYNDRKTRLAMVVTRAEAGKWSTRIQMPAEIEDNWSPARLVAYAWDENGREATGETEHIYVYGMEENPVEDDKGPDVNALYLNTPAFKPGGTVAPSPVLYAHLSDESGINLSGAGMGHRLTLAIDDKDYYIDADQYFTANPDEWGSGVLRYRLDDIAAGEHTLRLTVWDNLGNYSHADLPFVIGASVEPVIHNLSTDVNPATTAVNFLVDVDRPDTSMECEILVFDLNGRQVWSSTGEALTSDESRLTRSWDLCDSSGNRVPRGIYIYRARVQTAEGTWTSKARKLAVTAP